VIKPVSGKFSAKSAAEGRSTRVTSIGQMLVPPAVDANPPEDLVELGRIVEPFGVQGWLKIQAHSQSDTLVKTRKWWLRKHDPRAAAQADGVSWSGQTMCATVLSAKPHGGTLVASWSGLSDRDQADAWRNWSVWLPRSAFPKTSDDEFYWVDLVGCDVTAEGGVVLGKVAEVLDNGAHAILRVQRYAAPGSEPVDVGSDNPVQGAESDPWQRDAKGRIQEVLVPFVEAFVGTVDIAARRIDTTWPVDF
jgi:16S rRNA processing protein RimM